jgi:hypothetical protein
MKRGLGWRRTFVVKLARDDVCDTLRIGKGVTLVFAAVAVVVTNFKVALVSDEGVSEPDAFPSCSPLDPDEPDSRARTRNCDDPCLHTTPTQHPHPMATAVPHSPTQATMTSRCLFASRHRHSQHLRMRARATRVLRGHDRDRIRLGHICAI